MAAKPLAVGAAGAGSAATEQYVSKEEVDKAVSLYFSASKERQEVTTLQQLTSFANMMPLPLSWKIWPKHWQIH